jgi:hypothetical protein
MVKNIHTERVIVLEINYDKIIPLPDFLLRSKEEQQRYLEEYRKRFSNKEITNAWDKKVGYIYQLMNNLQMKKDTTKPRKQPIRKAPIKIPVSSYVEPVPEPVPEPVQTPPETLQEADGFVFRVKGTYNASTLIKRLEKLELMLTDEESEFEINLLIKEIIKTS